MATGRRFREYVGLPHPPTPAPILPIESIIPAGIVPRQYLIDQLLPGLVLLSSPSFPTEKDDTEHHYGAPPTFVDEGQGYLTIAERRVSHREALEQKYREHQFARRQNEVSQLRHFYG